MEAIEYLNMVESLKSVDSEFYRFLAKVKINKDTGCWEWTNSVRHDYGRFKLYGNFEGAHRVSYLFFIGEIPDGMFVCHKCDNPKCVNPNHLFLGTAKDNAVDAYNKGRMTLPKGNYGFKQGHIPQNRSISEEIVRIIKNEISDGLLSLKKISELHNVKYQTVRDISANRSYVDIN